MSVPNSNAVRLREIASEMRGEAENISPVRGHSKGQAHPAPSIRLWASQVESVARTLEHTTRD